MKSNMSAIERVLVFDVWGDYAHFRRGYTTTSPLTYPFPSRTTLAGLVSAILGLPRDSYYEVFGSDNSAFALQILNPIKKVKISQNLIDTKQGLTPWEIRRKKQAPRTQISFEFVKNPKYRVFVWLKDLNKFEELRGLIEEHKSIYTPYLGISECIANFKVFGEGIYEIEKRDTDTDREGVEIHSIIRKEAAKKMVMEKGKRYGTVRLPGFMDLERIVLSFIDFYYEENGKPLKIADSEYYTVKGENVNFIFF